MIASSQSLQFLGESKARGEGEGKAKEKGKRKARGGREWKRMEKSGKRKKIIQKIKLTSSFKPTLEFPRACLTWESLALKNLKIGSRDLVPLG